jgi:hypothetical protein
MAKNLYGYGLNLENPYGRDTTGDTATMYHILQFTDA